MGGRGCPELLTSSPNSPTKLSLNPPPSPRPTPAPGWGGAPRTRLQSSPRRVSAKSVGVAGPGLERRRCGSQGSFSPQPIPLHLRKHPTSQRAERAVRPAKCCESPDFHVVAQDPAPSPRPRPPARGNRKGRAATALGGSAGSGGGCGAYLGPQPDPWPHALRRPGRGRGVRGGRRQQRQDRA